MSNVSCLVISRPIQTEKVAVYHVAIMLATRVIVSAALFLYRLSLLSTFKDHYNYCTVIYFVLSRPQHWFMLQISLLIVRLISFEKCAQVRINSRLEKFTPGCRVCMLSYYCIVLLALLFCYFD